jgi:hypothetical protein
VTGTAAPRAGEPGRARGADPEPIARADPEPIARAEHELRGAATALALVCETLRRDPAADGHAEVIDAQLDRLRAGLEDLSRARSGDRVDLFHDMDEKGRHGSSGAATGGLDLGAAA